MDNLSVIILTFNSERTLKKTLNAALQVSHDIHIVDSFSTDRTLELAKRGGVTITQHEFINYSAQRNWACENLPLSGDWQLHLDADERLSEELITEIRSLAPPSDTNGYMIARLVHFLSRPIRHGGMYPIWHLRLFRNGLGRCENRLYDQHFVVSGEIRKLSHPFIDDHRNSLSDWTARHNHWSDAEAAEISSPPAAQEIIASFSGNAIEKKRAARNAYYRYPLFIRAFLLFFYRYVLRLGFLDGREGLIFFVLQTFWFRFLVDAKLYESRSPDDRG